MEGGAGSSLEGATQRPNGSLPVDCPGRKVVYSGARPATAQTEFRPPPEDRACPGALPRAARTLC